MPRLCNVRLPFVYDLAPPKKRTRDFRRGWISAMVPEISRADVPLAYICTIAATRANDGKKVDIPYRLWNGHLVRPIFSYEGQPMSPEAYATAAGEPFGGLGLTRFLSHVEDPLGAAGARHAISDEDPEASSSDARQKALARATDLVSGMAIIDDQLHVPCPEPVWAVRLYPAGVDVSIEINPDVFPPLFAFGLDSDAYAAFANEFASRIGTKAFVWGQWINSAIVRFDKLQSDSLLLNIRGVFTEVAKSGEEFLPAWYGDLGDLFRSIKTEAEKLSDPSYEPADLDRLIALFFRVPDLAAEANRQAFKSKAQSKRFRHIVEVAEGVEVFRSLFFKVVQD